MIRQYHDRNQIEPYHPTVLDIETEGVEGTCIGVGMAWSTPIGISYEAFENWDGWLSGFRLIYLKSDKDTRQRLRTIYAHNGSRFDWLHLARWLIDRDYIEELKCIQSGSSVIGINISMRIGGERFDLRLRDSFKLLPTSLKEVTKTFQLTQQKIELDALPEFIKPVNPTLFWEYLKVDVLALQETLYRFWSMIVKITGTIGELPMTLPAMAMRLFRMMLKEEIYTPSNPGLKKHERNSYTGGRTECLKPGEYPLVKIYDVNSEYPAVMLSGVYPVSYVGAWTKQYNGKHGIYQIRFNQTNRHQLPVLGVLENGGYHFQYEGEGYYTHLEIEKMLQVGGDIQVLDGYQYYHMGNPFKEFIEKWYSIRLEAQAEKNEALSFTCKILMNSLYGKFGQNEIGHSIQLWSSERITKELLAGTIFQDLGDCVIVPENRRSENTFCGIASYVTSQARLLLYSYMEQAQQLGNEVVYVDTDSVHCVGGADLPTDKGLGKLKLEYTGGAEYAGKKLYRLTDSGKIKAKGIGKKIKQVNGVNTDTITPEQFTQMVRGEAGIGVSFDVFPTPNEVLSGKRKPAIFFTRTRTIKRTS